MSHQSTEIHNRRKHKTRSDGFEGRRWGRGLQNPLGTSAVVLCFVLRREFKHAFVQPRVTNDLAADTGAQNSFKHVLLEASNNGVMLQHVHDRGMTLQNVRSTILVAVDEF